MGEDSRIQQEETKENNKRSDRKQNHTKTSNKPGSRRYRKYRKYKSRRLKRKYRVLIGVILLLLGLGVIYFLSWNSSVLRRDRQKEMSIPEYSGQAYVIVDNNIPFFDEKDIATGTFENYSELDSLGRCGTAFANLSREMMPDSERGEIGDIQPSGWKQIKYDGVVDSDPPYLYNRCHLIAYCLTGDNNNKLNLITGTRYMNVEGMLPFDFITVFSTLSVTALMNPEPVSISVPKSTISKRT